MLPYDDPKTGKHFEFEWQATVGSRVSGINCPYPENVRVWKGFNDLETYCHLNDMEGLLNEWHPTKNGDLKPSDVAPMSNKSVWWFLPYDDPDTGKHFNFEWESRIYHRTAKKSGCPYLSDVPKAVWKGFNDLETYCKRNGMEYLLDEWHPTKNGNLRPSDVTPMSNKRIWWFLPYDDPATGNHFDFEWNNKICSRVSFKLKCPYLSNHKVWKGFNDLETYCKLNGLDNLLDEWHPTKNNGLKPDEIPSGGGKRLVWWKKPYDDPITGKHFEFEWKADLRSRIHDNCGCPYLSDPVSKVWKGFNDIVTYCHMNDMDYLIKEWHPTKNGSLKPSDVSANSGKKVWWLFPYDDPITGAHFDFEWEASIFDRVNSKRKCPFLSNARVWKGFNDLETFCKLNGMEYLLDEWHPTKNKISPTDILPKVNKQVWWLLSYDDSKTGKHFDFEWKASPLNRVLGKQGCPYLENVKVWKGFNDLETYCKAKGMEYLLNEWHHVKNRKITPSHVAPSSSKKVWWQCHNGHEWRAVIASRVRGKMCPKCAKDL